MAIKYVWVNWRFNWSKWRDAVQSAVSQHGTPFVAEYMGVHEVTVGSWMRETPGDSHRSFPHPQMSNFIAFCNAFELDPRAFWTPEE